MTSLQLFKAIGDIDDELITEASKTHNKQHKNTLAMTALIACIMLAVCLFTSQKVMQQNNSFYNIYKTVEKTSTETSQKIDSSVDNIVINNIDSLYSNKKFGGKLKEVSENRWQKQYGAEDFLKTHKKKYNLSFSDTQKVLYGVVELELSKNKVIEIKAADGKMLDSSFKKLNKTTIGNYKVAICKLCSENNGRNYCAIVNGGNAVYTIEENEMTFKEFVLLLKEIFEY